MKFPKTTLHYVLLGTLAISGLFMSYPWIRSHSEGLYAAESKNSESAGKKLKQSYESLEASLSENPLKNAYFGETHVHTSYSLDAYIGGARMTPDDAYRFAKGETMTVNGKKHNIVKPLDFAGVSDHAEFIGEMYSTQVKGAPGYDNPQLVELRNLKTYEDQEAWFMKYVVSNTRSGKTVHPPFYAGEITTQSAWKNNFDAAQRHYEPGRFTTLIGFEWTSVQEGGNMHRNIFFRDTNVPQVPFTSIDSSDEEKLWQWMGEMEKQGMKLFAIPHNSNASKGKMFETVDNSGKAFDATYAQVRRHFEPLIEMMQVKGNSEVNRKLWPADEFSDFENADSITNYSGRTFEKPDFVRWAVIKGLEYQKKIGANPFQLGFVGGTDNHAGAPSDVVEDNYIGSHGGADDSIEKRRDKDIAGWIMGKDSNPGSITGVWAPKNTRAAIWDAMAARETFATSGTRIQPRFFGGKSLTAQPTDPQKLIQEGYENGVPMGGLLQGLSQAPTFTFHAQKDPVGANLDRIQIIKGWVDKQGQSHEKIYEVAWSEGRKLDAKGRLAPVGNTVDVKTASYKNSIGSSSLMGSWTDPDFDTQNPALYYARVLEIPTPRWSTYDAVRAQLPVLNDVPATIQERAWTSPIWYHP